MNNASAKPIPTSKATDTTQCQIKVNRYETAEDKVCTIFAKGRVWKRRTSKQDPAQSFWVESAPSGLESSVSKKRITLRGHPNPANEGHLKTGQ